MRVVGIVRIVRIRFFGLGIRNPMCLQNHCGAFLLPSCLLGGVCIGLRHSECRLYDILLPLRKHPDFDDSLLARATRIARLRETEVLRRCENRQPSAVRTSRSS